MTDPTADNISIGILKENECSAAVDVWAPNYIDPYWEFMGRTFKSLQFLLAVALTHLFISCIFASPQTLSSYALLLLIAVIIQVSYVFVYFQIRFSLPADAKCLFSHWNHPDRRFLVARDETKGQRVVGTVAINRIVDQPNVTQLFRLRVLPNYQGRGIARRLNDACEEMARKEFNCRTMVLSTVSQHSSGIRFYEKNGYSFKKIFTRSGCYPRIVLNILMFEKQLEH